MDETGPSCPAGRFFSFLSAHEGRVNLQEGKGTYLPFTDFARMNRGWLATYSVTLEEARGNSAISGEAQKAWPQSGRVMISVCQGGPISTRPPKVTEEATVADTTADTEATAQE